MSFSSLPPELVHQIIESTVPHILHNRTYKERQQTLCRLSLVSRLFRSIAQPLLFEIVKLAIVKGAVKLPRTRASGGSILTHARLWWLIVKNWNGRMQEEVDRLAESFQVFETARYLTLSFIDERTFANLLSVTSSHLTYLQLSSSWFKTTNAILLPSLHNLTLYNVSLELFRSLVDPSTVPNLRNFAFVDYTEDSVRRLEEPSTSRFLLRLETLHFDVHLWLELDASFRQSVASRTLINTHSHSFRPACRSEVSIIHARIEGLTFDPLNPKVKLHTERLDSFASVIKGSSSLSLQSLYLDSSLQHSLVLPPFIRSSVDNLARTCQERKVDLLFDQAPISSDVDPFISAEFVRRQKHSREA
ncbi:hypothetical protein JCM5350_008165 [Sporobolomyces pararoseus]